MPKIVNGAEATPVRGHAAENFFLSQSAIGQAAMKPRASPRNPARYCCPACRQAVRNVLDRERKWLARDTLDGRMKRTIEYQPCAGSDRRAGASPSLSHGRASS